jgi:hypothetical protein
MIAEITQESATIPLLNPVTEIPKNALPCGLNPRCTTSSAIRCCAGMVGDVRLAAPCRISGFTTRNFAATLAMIEKKT